MLQYRIQSEFACRLRRESCVRLRDFLTAHRSCRIFLATWLICSTITPANAVNRELAVNQPMYAVGGVQGAIRLTTDNVFWMATSDCIVRFDDEYFERTLFPRGAKYKSLSAVFLGASRGGGLLRDGKMKVYDSGDGLLHGTLRRIAEGPPCVIRSSSSSGMAILGTFGQWQRVQVALAFSIEGRIFDASGTLWASTKGGRVYRWLPGATPLAPVAPKWTQPFGVSNLVPAIECSACIVGHNHETACRVMSGGTQSNLIGTHSDSAHVDPDEASWAMRREVLRGVRTTTCGDVVQIETLQTGFDAVDGFRGSRGARCLSEAKDGKIGFLGANSLERSPKRSVSTLNTEFVACGVNRARGMKVWSDEDLRVNPAAARLQIVNRGQAIIAAGLNDTFAIARQRDGGVWPGRTGMFWAQRADCWRADDVWVSVIRRDVCDSHEWRGSANGGLTKSRDDRVATVSCGASESLRLGYTDGRNSYVHGTTSQAFSGREGTGFSVVTARIDRGNDMWPEGEFGLRRWCGRRVITLLADREHAFEWVTGIVEIASGDVWPNYAAGIIRISAAPAIHAAAAPKVSTVVDLFDHLEGHLSLGARVPPLPPAIDGVYGKLWLVGTTGIFSSDSTTSIETRSAPPPLLNAMAANDTGSESNAFNIHKKGARALHCYFLALDLQGVPRVRNRYRFHKVDTEWHCRNSIAGKFLFPVVASTDGKNVSPREAALSCRIEPTSTEMLWFLALLLASITATALLSRWRVRQLGQRLHRKLDAQVAERDRIAREVHDTLLQSTQGLILRFQAISNQMPVEDPNRDTMEAALERADEVLTEGRDRVRGLRREAGGRAGLTSALRAFGDELSADSNIAFRFDSIGTEPPMSLEMADEIQRIVSEALLNAFRHSQASSIRLSVVNAQGQLQLLVEDDGVGIDVGTEHVDSRPGHWGLQGMRERSNRIGARLTIASRGEGGTRVELVLATRHRKRRV